MDPWPLLRYTQYIWSLSMFIRTFSFLALIVPEKYIMKIFKNGKIWKLIKIHNSKSYWPLATILPIHLPYFRDQVWYKFHRSRTINIKVIEQNAFYFFWKPTKGHNSKSYIPLAFWYTWYIQSLSMFTQTSFHSSWEICNENFQEWQNLKIYEGTELIF